MAVPLAAGERVRELECRDAELVTGHPAEREGCMNIKALGYVGFESPHATAWETFGPEIFGLGLAEPGKDVRMPGSMPAMPGDALTMPWGGAETLTAVAATLLMNGGIVATIRRSTSPTSATRLERATDGGPPR
jgi:hypothetical protein